MNLISIYLGYIFDLIVGDPYSFPHPVKYIGKLIKTLEYYIRKFFKTENDLKLGGFILCIATVVVTLIVTYFVVELFKFNIVLYILVNGIVIYTTLATKCLRDEALNVYRVLKAGDIDKTRIQLSYIVGRDTSELNEKEIIRATVETIAENTVDGIISPMFYAFIGGAPLAMAYKAINTLDSTVGYKNDKYINLGFASAKLDDIANYIPARLSVIFIPIACMILGYNAKRSYEIGIRDRKNHKSPNCAFSEGAIAGALGVQLGGTNVYFGKEVYKPTIGDKINEINAENVLDTNKIMYMTSLVSLLAFTLIYIVVIYIWNLK